MSRIVDGVVGVVLVGVLALPTSACSSGPSEAARSLCTSVGQVLGAPVDGSVVLNTQAITNGENSGDCPLDAAATHLAAALRQHRRQAIS
jgi:hypothetical protein